MLLYPRYDHKGQPSPQSGHALLLGPIVVCDLSSTCYSPKLHEEYVGGSCERPGWANSGATSSLLGFSGYLL